MNKYANDRLSINAFFRQKLQEEEARDRSLKQLKEMQTRKEQLIKIEKKLAAALSVESKADEVEVKFCFITKVYL